MADDIRALIAEAFACPPADLPEDAMIGEAPGWDSLGHMRLMLAIEAKIGRQLSPMEISGFVSIASIRDFLSD